MFFKLFSFTINFPGVCVFREIIRIMASEGAQAVSEVSPHVVQKFATFYGLKISTDIVKTHMTIFLIMTNFLRRIQMSLMKILWSV